MEIKNWKVILAMGIALALLGLYVFTFDRFIGILAIGFGGYNIYKGIRIKRGHQPYIIRKYNEQDEDFK